MTFGKPLLEHQVIRHKIADMSAKIDQIESYMHLICWQVTEGTMPVAEICKAKLPPPKHWNFVPRRRCRFSVARGICVETP